MPKYNITRHSNKKRYKIKAKREYRPKAPFVRSFGYISCGAAFFTLLIWILTMPSYDKLSDYIGAIGFSIVLGGLGLLSITVGIRMRRW